tara:strand:- start:9 stop:686 length:678 start_codon:yes stop_codon:yes gene_type:complete
MSAIVKKLQTLLIRGLEANDETTLKQVGQLNEALADEKGNLPFPNYSVDKATKVLKKKWLHKEKFFMWLHNYHKEGFLPVPKEWLQNLYITKFLPALEEHILYTMLSEDMPHQTTDIQGVLKKSTPKGFQVEFVIRGKQFFLFEKYEGYEHLQFNTISMKDIIDPTDFQKVVLEKRSEDLEKFLAAMILPFPFESFFHVDKYWHTPYKFKKKYYEKKIVFFFSHK